MDEQKPKSKKARSRTLKGRDARWWRLFRFSEETLHLLLAGLIGVVGGFVNVVFFTCVEAVQQLALHHRGDLVEIAEVLPLWQRFFYPVAGGLAAGLVLQWGLRMLRHQGTTNMVEVVVAGDGRLPFRSALIKAISSMISIGTGASIGREGAITQMTSTIASKIGQWGSWPPYRLRLLVACGASSGMAAAYNAPVAGSLFAAIIVLGNFSMAVFAPLVFSSVIATLVSRTFFGIEPLYVVPEYQFSNVAELPWFFILGAFSGFLGVIFLKMLAYVRERFQKSRLPIFGRLVLGGLLVGVIAVEFPLVWGNGYGATSRLLTQEHALLFIVSLMLAKLLATVVAVGSGTVGGVFTPTLFLGAGLGCAFGGVLHVLGVDPGISTGAMGLVGMGAVLAATLHAPLLAMIMVFEISQNYSLMPPLMLACVLSSLVARSFHPDSVYTEQLRAKGVQHAGEHPNVASAMDRTVGDLMRDPVQPVSVTDSLPEIGRRFIRYDYHFLPVVDPKQRLVGLLAIADFKSYLRAGEEMRAVTAYDMLRPVPRCLTPNQKLIDALPILIASEQRNVPVVNNLKEYRLIGSLNRTEALSFVSDVVAHRS